MSFHLPVNRGECDEQSRPCPFVTCKHHLLVEVSSNGKLSKRFEFDEADEDSIAEALQAMPETCVLDAAGSELSYKEIGAIMNLNHVYVYQVATGALLKAQAEILRIESEVDDD